HLVELLEEGRLGGEALRFLLRRGVAARPYGGVVLDLVDEALVVVGAALLEQSVDRKGLPLALSDLLERRLVVVKGDLLGADGRDVLREDPPRDISRPVDSGVEVDRREDRLEGVGEERASKPAAGLGLPDREAQRV